MKYQNAPFAIDRAVALLGLCLRGGTPGERHAACAAATRELKKGSHQDSLAAARIAWEMHRHGPDARAGLEAVLTNLGVPWSEFEGRPSPRRPAAPPRAPVDRDLPPWQTDERARYHDLHPRMGFVNLNNCLKAIWEASLPYQRHKITFQAFDGAFSRGVFTAWAAEETLGFGGEVMEAWNSHGACPYRTEAVFATSETLFGPRTVRLVRLHGRDVSERRQELTHDSFNLNPFNDPAFVREARALVEKTQ